MSLLVVLLSRMCTAMLYALQKERLAHVVCNINVEYTRPVCQYDVVPLFTQHVPGVQVHCVVSGGCCGRRGG